MIARQLGFEARTAKAHVNNAIQYLHAKTRAQALAHALVAGQLSIRDLLP